MKSKPIVMKLKNTDMDEFMKFYHRHLNAMHPVVENETSCDDTERYVRIEFIYKGDLFKLISHIKKITKKNAVKTTIQFGSDAELDEYIRRFKKQRED